MVCKEEILMWFKTLKGYARIEVLCGLLNMCCPLELRFAGTCLEDLGRRDYMSLRDEEIKANSLAEIVKVSNIMDPIVRSRLIVYLGLMKSSSAMCSTAIFKILVEEIKVESMASAGVLSDPKLVNEVLLLLIMGMNHPAFTFEQQNYFAELYTSFRKYLEETVPGVLDEKDDGMFSSVLNQVNMSYGVRSESGSCGTSACHHYDQASCARSSDAPHRARIVSLKMKAPHKKACFRIRVSWCNGKISDVTKTPYEIAVFHQKLAQLFPHEVKASSQEKYIPHLPSTLVSCAKQDVVNDNLISTTADYLRQLSSHLPLHVLESEHVVNFFQPSVHCRTLPSRVTRNVDTKNNRLPSLTIYNSHMSEGSSVNRNRNAAPPRKVSENGTPMQPGTPPMASPLMSPQSSPYVSPTASGTNSRSVSPWTHRSSTSSDRLISAIPDGITFEKMLLKEQLHEYWDRLRHYRIEDLQVMSQEELECLGLLKDAAAKLRRILDSIRACSAPNGITSHYISRSSVPSCQPPSIKGGLLLHQASAESSPVCSEYSSPPPSPSPTDTCTSSSSEEISADKGGVCKNFDMNKIREDIDLCSQEATSKTPEEALGTLKECRDGNRHVSPLGYTCGINPLPQSHKPSFLPLQCSTTPGAHHLGHGTVIFDSHFSRIPLPSALTLPPHSATVPQRSHAGTPERVLTSSSGLPITTICPFPVVTSGCTTVPSVTCNITTYKSCSSTSVTNTVVSGNGSIRQMQQKTSMQPRESDVSSHKTPQQQVVENLYSQSCGYLLALSTAQQAPPTSCSCLCTTNCVRPSPAPSPSLSSGPGPQALPVSLPYIGLPYVFPPTIPFLQTHSNTPANGFISPPSLPTASPGHSFGFTLPNGMSGIPPELIYGGQAFSLPSPSQANPAAVPPPVSQGYLNNGNFPQPVSVSAMAVTHATLKIATCYNCGKVGHRGSECKEQTIDELSKPGKYQLNYSPSNPLETHD